MSYLVGESVSDAKSAKKEFSSVMYLFINFFMDLYHG